MSQSKESFNAERQYPDGADIVLASKDGSQRFEVKTPKNSIMSVPAMTAEQAKELAADEYRGFSAEQFTVLPDDHDYEPEPYPSPVESGRAVTANDIWLLRLGMPRTRSWSWNRHSPTDRMLNAILSEWEDPDTIPLHDPEALQQADGIGPKSASRIASAAVYQDLIPRIVR